MTGKPNIGQLIAVTAMQYLAQTETKNNSGFTDKNFEAKIKTAGWMPGESWCVYFAEMVWQEAYEGDSDITVQLTRLFNGSATKTFSNFKTDGRFVISQVPVPGALIIFQYGNTWQGHAGIVIDSPKNESFVITVEGNTNDDGSREGVKVCQKIRKLNQSKGKGLNILGFVYPL